MNKTLRGLNYCYDCDHTWYPRGHDLSMKCPHCGSDDVGDEPTDTDKNYRVNYIDTEVSFPKMLLLSVLPIVVACFIIPPMVINNISTTDGVEQVR